VAATEQPTGSSDHSVATTRRSNRTRRPAVHKCAAATHKSPDRRTNKHKNYSATHRSNRKDAEAAVVHSIAEHLALLGSAINPDTGLSAEYNELINSSAAPLWIAGNTKEIRRLLATKTIRFIAIKEIPAGIKPTYLRIVSAFRPEKEDPYRIRWTIGGDRVIFTGEVSTKAADITTVKTHFNSVLSTPNARHCCCDVKDFYLNTPLDPKDYAYMRIPIKG
jgi:hypothetical protein